MAEIQQFLEEHVILLCPTLGWWRGQYQMPRDTTEVKTRGETVAQDDITTPRAKLMSDKYPLDSNGKPWQKRFQAHDSRLQAIKNKFSVPFQISGVRIVPKHAGKSLFDELYGLTYGQLCDAMNSGDTSQLPVAMTDSQMRQALRIAQDQYPTLTQTTPIFNPALDGEQSLAYNLERDKQEFCDNWPEIRRQIESHNNVFRHVASKVPTRAKDMADKFYLDVVPVELAGSGHTTEVTMSSLKSHSDIVREVCQRRVQQAIDDMIAEPRNQLAAALEALNTLIARDGRVTARSFQPVRAAIEKIRMFDCVASDELLERIKQLEQRLDSTNTRDMTQQFAAQSGFTAAMESFMQEVNNEAARHRDSANFGRARRRIDVGSEKNDPAVTV